MGYYLTDETVEPPRQTASIRSRACEPKTAYTGFCCMGDINQYVFCGNNPVNFVDPFGLRWVDVYVWEWSGVGVNASWSWPGSRVGHVMVTEAGSQKVLLSQFPPEGRSYGPQRQLDYWDTFKDEGSGASKKYSVFVPDDKAFDSEVCSQKKRANWAKIPKGPNETHCTRAAYDALKAGGVPLSGQDEGQLLPGNFGTMLEDLMGTWHSGDKWSIRHAR